MRRIVWCMLLSSVILNSQGQSGKVDSVSALLDAHPAQDTIRVNLLNELSWQNISINNYKVRDYADQALVLATRLSYAKGIARANNRLSRAAWTLGESDGAIEYALRAESIIEKEKLGDELLAECYQTLGFAYLEIRELSKAEFYFRASERKHKQGKNSSFLFRTYLGLSTIKIYQNQLDSLSYYEKKCVRALEENSDSFNKALLKYLNSYNITDPKLAIDSFSKTLVFAQAVGNKYVETMSMMMLGLNFLNEKNYAQAEKYTQGGLQLSQASGMKNLTLQNYQLLIDLRKRQNRFEEAMAYQKSYYELKDSIFNGRKTRQAIELETKYEKEKREQEIKLLVQQKRADTILKYSLTMGLAAVILASVLIYKLQRSRAKKAQELLVLQKTVNEKLKETDLVKSRFFANISHEFRTPLSLIISPLQEKLNSGSLLEGDAKLFRLVLHNANQLLSLVNEMLDLSKLEAKKMELRIQKGGLDKFFALVVAAFDSLAESKKIHFEKRIHLMDREMWFDKEKLEKILNNLLFNAFKFTSPGGSVQIDANVDEKGYLNLKVTDNGTGISEEDQPYIFTSFYRAQYSSSQNIGTGLGLALVKELVTLYNGHIKLESTPGRGTAIFVSLPVTMENLKHAESIESQAKDLELETHQVDFPSDVPDDFQDGSDEDQLLIIEDNPDLRNFIASVMGAKYSIITAQDGEEGWRVATEHVPNVVISDVMMPKLDGVSLAEKMKSDERTSHIPIILLTAKADMDSRIKGLRAGADDYLVKPFSTEELQARVDNLVEQRKKLMTKFRSKLKFPMEPAVAEASMDEKFLVRARRVIENNIGDSTFGVMQFADEMNMSRANIFRKLKAIVGQSPNEVINEVRLLRAAEMIRAKTDTLAQISYAVGFKDQSYFSKRFKKRFGVTPREYAGDTASA